MATGDIIAAEIRGTASLAHLNGWVIALKIEGWSAKTVESMSLGWTAPNTSLGNNPNTDTPSLTLSLTSPGYEVSGSSISATTRARTLWGSRRIRKPFPDQAQFETIVEDSDLWVLIGLTGYAYEDDSSLSVSVLANTVTATDASTSNAVTGLSVTNNSTVAYPKPKACWVGPSSALPGTRLGEVYDGMVFADAKHGIGGVLFTVSDESSNEVSQAVADPAPKSSERNPSSPYLCKIPCYQASLDITSLDQGELGTARVRVYPWIGNAASVFDSNSHTAPALRSRPHRIDHAGTYRTVYAYVDGVGGDNSTGVASENAATARANPYASPWDAQLGIRGYINTTFSQSNNVDGGVIRLMDNAGADQDYAWGRPGFTSVMSAPGAFLIYEPDPLNTGRVTFRTKNSTADNRCATVIFRVPIQPASGQQSNFLGSVGADDWYVHDRTELVSEQTTANNLWNAIENITVYDCLHKDHYGGMLSSSNNIWAEFDGYETTTQIANPACMLGFRLIEDDNAWLVNSPPSTILNWTAASVTNNILSHFVVDTNSDPWQGTAQTNTFLGYCVINKTTGLAVVGVSDRAQSDCLYRHITATNCRFNVHNENTPNSIREREFVDCVAFASMADKQDNFGNDSSLTGGWPNSWGATRENNFNGRSQFPFQWDGLHMYVIPDSGDDPPTNPDIDENFVPTPTSELAGLVRAGTVTSKRFDLNGIEVPNDGSGYAGALQRSFGSLEIETNLPVGGIPLASGSTWSWGTVADETQVVQSIELTNTGDATLVLDLASATIDTTGGEVFTKSSGVWDDGVEVAPDASVLLGVAFNAATDELGEGVYERLLSIPSNDPASPYTLTLRAEIGGVPQPPVLRLTRGRGGGSVSQRFNVRVIR